MKNLIALTLMLTVNTQALGASPYRVYQNYQLFEVVRSTADHSVTLSDRIISYTDPVVIFIHPVGPGAACEDFGVPYKCGSNSLPTPDRAFQTVDELKTWELRTYCKVETALVKSVLGKDTLKTVLESNVTVPAFGVGVCYNSTDIPRGVCEEFSCESGERLPLSPTRPLLQ